MPIEKKRMNIRTSWRQNVIIKNEVIGRIAHSHSLVRLCSFFSLSFSLSIYFFGTFNVHYITVSHRFRKLCACGTILYFARYYLTILMNWLCGILCYKFVIDFSLSLSLFVSSLPLIKIGAVAFQLARYFEHLDFGKTKNLLTLSFCHNKFDLFFFSFKYKLCLLLPLFPNLSLLHCCCAHLR